MIPFAKMHGIGNDFVMVNLARHPLDPAQLPALSIAMCDRRFGVGSDGLILAEKSSEDRFRMRMFNPDGSESEMCGNGIRCLAAFLQEEGLTTKREILVETGAGDLTLHIKDSGDVTVDMGLARLTRGEIGMQGEPTEKFLSQPIRIANMEFFGTAVSMGNPHLVIFVDDVEKIPLEQWGPALEHHTLFPERVNVHFVSVLTPAHLRQRTWERGAGATLACGTGACASAVAAFLDGHTGREVTVSLPGGNLEIDFRENGSVFMTGPAETVFRGTWPN